jgi:hypothetical protein
VASVGVIWAFKPTERSIQKIAVIVLAEEAENAEILL